jgi:peptide/nickel transport system permease protein
MAAFALKRTGAAVIVLLLLVLTVFALQRTSKADPVRAKLGAGASAEAIAREHERLGWDDPLPVQFVHYVGGVVTGDFGESVRTSRPVYDDLRAFLPASIELIVAILLVASVLGVGLGLFTARASARAGVVRVTMLLLSSIPGFLLTLLGILYLYRRLGMVPASGRSSYADAPTGPTGFLTLDGLLAGRPEVSVDALHHLVLPAVAAAIVPAVAIARVLRSSLVATMASDQVRTARAKGLTERQVVLRQACATAPAPRSRWSASSSPACSPAR